MAKTKYEYNPGHLDRFDPKVLRGEPITPGALVTVTRRKVDPIGLFRWVTDGVNEQSVFKQALTRKGF